MRRTNGFPLPVVLALLVATQVAFPSSACAALGDLDLDFGTDGWAVTELGGRADTSVSGVAMRSDGAIVVVYGGSGAPVFTARFMGA